MRTEYREEPCQSALNRVNTMGMAWSLNPYTGCAHRCTFCYVRGFERRAARPSDDRYGRSIRVKTNIVEVLRRELGRRSWKRERVVIGTATDPYQPCEGSYGLTRGCIATLSASRTPVGIITRGPLIVRDIDVLSEAAVHGGVSVNVSVPTLDGDVWRKTEPGTAPPLQRLRAVRMLTDAGIEAGVGIAPILPGLSDRPEQLEAVVRAARDAGATHVWCSVLNLRPGTREYFLEQLSRVWPELMPRYESLYSRPYLLASETAPLQGIVAALKGRFEIADRRPAPLTPEPAPAQLALFVR